MRNIHYKKFIVGLIFCFTACAELEEQPVGLLAPETLFTSPRDAEVAIFGAYGMLAHGDLYGRQFVSALMLRGDMVDIGDRGTPAERQQVNDFNMDADNGMVRRFWPTWYQVISAANAAIAGAEGLGLPEEEVNSIIAEARFIRAFSYYHLVRVFGDIPYVDYYISDPASVAEVSKTPASEVYEGIIEDLEFAKEWLPDMQEGAARSRATKGTAASYLASVHLTLENFQESYNEAKWVIDNKDRFGYALEENFQNLFDASLADGLKEHIFAIDFLGLQSVGNEDDDLMGSMTGIRGGDTEGWSVLVPSLEVYTSWDDRDYRKEVSFEDSVVMDGVPEPYTVFVNTKRPHIAKYTRFPGNVGGSFRNSDTNYPAMRYAEVLLIAAEALAEINGGPNDEAIGYVNLIRERARNWPGENSDYPADVPQGLGQAEFIDLILEERRLELAFEFKRWYDIKRRRLGEEAFTGPGSLEPHPNFDPARDYLFPLPQVDLSVNPNLRPQNPGY